MQYFRGKEINGKKDLEVIIENRIFVGDNKKRYYKYYK